MKLSWWKCNGEDFAIILERPKELTNKEKSSLAIDKLKENIWKLTKEGLPEDKAIEYLTLLKDKRNGKHGRKNRA
jgi:DNA-binding transcriptional regulator YhcF (GntR family)